jgi:hypothetical protein
LAGHGPSVSSAAPNVQRGFRQRAGDVGR